MTIQTGGRTFGVSALLLIIAIGVFVLGVAGVHLGSIEGVRMTDLGLVFFAASFLL